MRFLISALCLILSIAVLAGCKKKKASLTGEEPVEVSDFIDAFPVLNLPYKLTDTLVAKKDKDSLLVNYKIFTQFVPDSILQKDFGKNSKPRIYMMGKTGDQKKETYLVAKAVQGNKKFAYLICFDKNNSFLAAMPFVAPDQLAATQQLGTIDKNFTITKTIQRKNADASISEGKDAYVLNNDTKSFMLIMTDALDAKPTELINPIDTLPRKNKLSGDYAKTQSNYVSIRDARKTDRLLFFVHIEQNKGECTGELKGEAQLTAPNTAVYRQVGDPCVLQFKFTATTVSLKEIEACGSHRDLRCIFDGSYPRKKEPKSKTEKKPRVTK